MGLRECRDGVQRGATFQGLPTGLLLGRAGLRRHGCQVHSGRHKITCSGNHGKGKFILKIDPEEMKQMLSTSIQQKVGRNSGPLFNSSIPSIIILPVSGRPHVLFPIPGMCPDPHQLTPCWLLLLQISPQCHLLILPRCTHPPAKSGS